MESKPKPQTEEDYDKLFKDKNPPEEHDQKNTNDCTCYATSY